MFQEFSSVLHHSGRLIYVSAPWVLLHLHLFGPLIESPTEQVNIVEFIKNECSSLQLTVNLWSCTEAESPTQTQRIVSIPVQVSLVSNTFLVRSGASCMNGMYTSKCCERYVPRTLRDVLDSTLRENVRVAMQTLDLL